MSSDVLMFALGAAILLSYWFSHLADRYRIPSVVLLLLTGIVARAITHAYHNSLVVPAQLISLLGTTGLVLIVLEGALDLRLDARRKVFLVRTFGAAVFGVASTTLSIGLIVAVLFGMPLLNACLIAAPFGVISSSVAIPTAAALDADNREFVIYESSWSDIAGVMLFNALLVAFKGGGVTLNLLGGSVVLVFAGALVTLTFYWLVGHLEGHVKFVPLLFALILVYAGADSLQLSPLLIVLILGLTLNNAQLLRRLPALDWLHSNHFEAELGRLKHLTAEATFFIRTFFFLLLGYVTDPRIFLELRPWLYAAGLVAIIFALRWITLYLSNGGRAFPLLWVAPRGLITVTLFLSTPAAIGSDVFPSGTLILVVLISCLVMASGLQIERSRQPDLPQISESGAEVAD